MEKEERLDIVDDEDRIVGSDTRKNIYKKGLDSHSRFVNIFVFNSRGELLVPKRSMNRRIFPGCFDFSCGEHVLSGETYDQAAKRGVKEELGLEGIELIELGKLNLRDGVGCFTKVYKTICDEKINNYDTDGIDKLYWFSLDEIKEMIKKNKEKFKHDFPIVLDRFFN